MAEYVTLMGAEQVQSAGRAMSAAADSMLRAASHIDSTMHSHQQFLNDWLNRLQAVLEAHTLGETQQ